MSWQGAPVGELAMGCEPLGGTDWGAVDIEQARRAVSAAFDMGIRAFDTADVYGLGRSEEELARALGERRHDAFVITKFGVRWQDDPAGGRARTSRDSSPAYLTTALEGSLRRLRLEAIPLYLVHWPDPATPIEDTLEALERARQAGKIVNYGLSNFGPEAIGQAAGIAAVEVAWNLIERSAELSLDAAARRSLVRIAYGPLAQGLLTGKYDRKSRFPASDRRSRLPHFGREAWERSARILEVVRGIAEKRGVTPAQIALRWVLDCGRVDMAVAGARSPDQVAANAAVAGWKLSDEEMDALTAT